MPLTETAITGIICHTRGLLLNKERWTTKAFAQTPGGFVISPTDRMAAMFNVRGAVCFALRCNRHLDCYIGGENERAVSNTIAQSLGIGTVQRKTTGLWPVTIVASEYYPDLDTWEQRNRHQKIIDDLKKVIEARRLRHAQS